MTGTYERPREILGDSRDAGTAPRRVSILGATGSVGTSTIDLVARENAGRTTPAFDVVALTAHRNVDLLIERARALRPDIAVIGDEAAYRALAEGLAGTGIETAAGQAAVVEAAGRPADWTMAAIVGAAGLAPTLAALAASRAVALANKECLVCAGELFLAEAKRRGTRLLPVDSEHNAVFQVFDFDRPETVESIVLTASGGPFRTFTREQMAVVTPAEACAHPNWSMGAKISIDSATMMNKGLELIEAFYLFPVEARQLSAVVHPQSIVHALVRYVDGSVLAQLASPDMRTPIAHALAWPERMRTPCRRLDFASALSLTFEPPDETRFPALALARAALERRGPYPTVLNAANEIAVAAFLAGRIGFLDIATTVDHVLTDLWDHHHPQSADRTTPDLAGLMAIDADARRLAEIAIARQRTVTRPLSQTADTRAAS